MSTFLNLVGLQIFDRNDPNTSKMFQSTAFATRKHKNFGEIDSCTVNETIDVAIG